MNSRLDFRYTFTVFTPTYNRARLLPRVFESLKQQSFRDFEWLIVDDGSTDNTPEAVHILQVEAPFPIRYVGKPNGGKPSAVNRGASEANGYLFAILDSDDWYVPQALEQFWYHWRSISSDAQPRFVGVTGLCSDPAGSLIGGRFPTDVFDSDAIDMRYRYRVKGEKGGVLKTDVMRQFPYPEELGKYISESLVWNRMAKSYQTRFINEILTVKDFQPGGITRDGRFLQVRNGRASLLAIRELIDLGDRLPLTVRIRAYANYVRHSLHQGISLHQQIAEAPSKALFCGCYFLGACLKVSDAALLKQKGR